MLKFLLHLENFLTLVEMRPWHVSFQISANLCLTPMQVLLTGFSKLTEVWEMGRKVAAGECLSSDSSG